MSSKPALSTSSIVSMDLRPRLSSPGSCLSSGAHSTSRGTGCSSCSPSTAPWKSRPLMRTTLARWTPKGRDMVSEDNSTRPHCMTVSLTRARCTDTVDWLRWTTIQRAPSWKATSWMDSTKPSTRASTRLRSCSRLHSSPQVHLSPTPRKSKQPDKKLKLSLTWTGVNMAH